MQIDLARLESIFSEALSYPPAERAAYLDRACGGDPELRRRSEQLLASHEAAGSFLAAPAVEPGAPTVDLPPFPEKPGTRIGRYRLLELLGEGGMGSVFMAEQEEPVRRKVALKIIKAGLDSRQVLARFEAERQALAVMDHPNIARVLDAGTSERGQPYFVMELVKGVPVTRYCDERRLTPRARLELFVPVCQAVQHAHQKGIIHRDLKPTNVLVADYDERPVVKVIDFGVAKAVGAQLTEKTLFTHFGQVVGTLDYMSPEQAKLNQLDIDTRSDVYSLGALLYELLTGTVPFDRKRIEQAAFDEILRIIREEEPPTPSTRLSTTQELPAIAANRGLEPKALSGMVKGELDWIVMKALEKDRNRRYETASALARDVENHLRDEPVLACPPSALYRLRKFARRRRTALAVAALVLAFLVILGGAVGWEVRDRAGRRRTLEQSVNSALEEAAAWHRREKWTEAMAALKRAETLLAAGEVASTLDQRVKEWRSDLEAVGRLEEIRSSHDDRPRETGWDYRPEAFAAYEREFRSLRIDLDQLDAKEASAHICSRLIRDQLIAALDDWTVLGKIPGIGSSNKDKQWWRRPLSAARAADVDGFRNRVRLAVEEDDQKTLLELARSPEAVNAWASTLLLLHYSLGNRELRIELLADAQRAHPGDFFLNMQLALVHQEPPQKQGILWTIGKRFIRRPQVNQPSLPYAMAAVALRPESAWAWTVLGHALWQSGRLDEAIAAHRRAIHLKPDFFVGYHNLGHHLREKGKLEEAEAAYRKGIALNPDFARGYAMLAALLAAQGRLDEAESACRKAVQLRPDDSFPYSELGHVLREQGRLDEAVAAQLKVIELDPGDAVARTNLGATLKQKGAFAEAEGACRKAIEVQPDYASAHNVLGAVLIDRGKPVEGEAALRRAIELQPDHPEAWSHLGVALNQQGKLEEAISAYRKALELDPDSAQAQRNLGATLARQGKPEEAITLYRKALELEPKDPQNHVVYMNLGDALEALGKNDESVVAYRRAIELKPDYAQPYVNLGASLAEEGKFDEAVAAFRKAIDLKPDIAEAHYNLAGALASQHKFDEAVAAVRKAIGLQPKDPAGYNSLAWLLATCPDVKVRNPVEAVELAGKAMALEPGNGSFWNTLGVARYRTGNWQPAIEALRKSMELSQGGDAIDWFFLAMAHRRLGDQAEASKWYDRGVEWMDKNRPDDEDLRRFRLEADELLGIPPAKER